MTTTPSFRLTPEQIAFFNTEGYLSVPALTTPEDVARIRDIYDRLFTQRAGRDKGDQFDLAGTDEDNKEAVMPQILNPAGYAPELKETLLLTNVGILAKQLFGDAVSFGFAHAIYKPPRISPETPWHQDASYWHADYDYKSVSIWVPLQEATLENGCMHFIPRSHVGMNILRHRSINNDPRIHGLELDPAELHHVKNSVACPLPPGGCTIHGGYMLHYAGPNISDIPRRAIILNAGLPGTKRAVPRDLYWNREKQTARTQRALAAQQAGEKVQPPPRGAGDE